MTAPQTLSDKFRDIRIEAANTFMHELADAFEARLAQKVREGVTIRTIHFDENHSAEVPSITFNDPVLTRVKLWEAARTTGYARLEALCEKANICMGVPYREALARAYQPSSPAMLGNLTFYTETDNRYSRRAVLKKQAEERAVKQQKRNGNPSRWRTFGASRQASPRS